MKNLLQGAMTYWTIKFDVNKNNDKIVQYSLVEITVNLVLDL